MNNGTFSTLRKNLMVKVVLIDDTEVLGKVKFADNYYLGLWVQIGKYSKLYLYSHNNIIQIETVTYNREDDSLSDAMGKVLNFGKDDE